MIIQNSVRIIVYGLLMVLLYLLIYKDASQQGQEIKFMESTYTEWAQQLILLLMGSIFLHCAYHFVRMRCLSILLAGFSAAGLVREFNNFFNEQVFDGAWQLSALTVMIITGVFVSKYRNDFWKDVAHYHHSLSYGLLLGGFLVTFIFSRLFGKTALWEVIMEEKYFRSVKNAAEEGVELLGYGLLLVAAVEYFILVRAKRSRIS